MKRIRITIRGKVQRVGFRYYIKTIAYKMGLDGWVKNTQEGDVEILVEGPERLLKEFVNYCKKGPALSKIEDVEVNDDFSAEKLRGFEILF